MTDKQVLGFPSYSPRYRNCQSQVHLLFPLALEKILDSESTSDKWQERGYHPFLASCWITLVNKYPLLGIHICKTSLLYKLVSQPIANIAGVFIFVIVILSLSCVQHFATSWTIAHQIPLSSTISQSLLKFISMESVILSNHLILCHPLILTKFPCRGFMHAHRSYHKMKGCLSPL